MPDDKPSARADDCGRAHVPPASRSGKWVASVFSFAMIVAVASPIAENWRAAPNDSFPLSYYPMFSAKRGETARVTYAVGIDAHGASRQLHYRYAAGGGMNQARRRIHRMVQTGRAGELCTTIARNIARRPAAALGGIVAVEVRTGRFSLREYFETADRTPTTEFVHHRCPVER
jgi:hypothetical protein